MFGSFTCLPSTDDRTLDSNPSFVRSLTTRPRDTTCTIVQRRICCSSLLLYCALFQMITRINSACLRINPSAITTAIKRRIRIGTTDASSQRRAAIISLFAFGTTVIWILMGTAVRNCHITLAEQMPTYNKSTVEGSIECLIFNSDCRCRKPSNGTLVSDLCLTRLQVHINRILPVVSTVLQLFAFREFVTLGVDCNRLFSQVA